jgi:cysteine-rich repeat protein
MQPGDTIDVAAGIYEGPFNPGRVRCTATLPCTIRGAGMFTTVLRGMRPATDWQSMGNGVYRRTMQASADPITTADDGYPMRDAYDPANLYQRNGYVEPGSGLVEHLPLGYAGDGVTSPGDGQWSYDPTTHTVFANPYGSAPIGDVLIPFVSRLFDLRQSSGHWTVQDLSLEGARAFIADHQPDGGSLPGMVFRNVGAGYVPRWIMRLNPVPGVTLDNVRLRWIARGTSAIVPEDQRSGYGIRLFGAHGSTITGLDCRHLGSGTSWCGGACMPPWNGNSFTVVPHGGHCVDIKQTDGFTFSDGVIDAGPVQGGVKVDVSRNGTVATTRFTRNVRAIVLNAQTPTTGFTTTYSIFVDENLFDGNVTDFTVDTPATSGYPTATLLGNRRLDGSPLVTEPSPLPPSVVVLPDSGVTTTSTTATSTTSTTRSTTTSTTTSTTRSTTTSTTTSTTRSTTTSTTTSTTGSASSSTSTSASSSTSVPSTSSTTIGSSSSTSTSSSSTSTSSSSTSTSSSTSSTTTTLPSGPLCGNGVLEGDEQCDDGNLDALDGCDGNCLLEEVAAVRRDNELSTDLTPPTDPLAASIMTPSLGSLVIIETSPTIEPPPDLALVGRQVHIQAPSATTSNPIEIRLTIDNTVLSDPGVSPDLGVLRNGVLVSRCSGLPGRALPNPCVSGEEAPDIDLTTLVVLSSRGGNWNLVVPDTASSTTTLPAATTTTTSSTTSTTVPRSERHVRGTELLLRDRPGRPAARRLVLLSRDATDLMGGARAAVPSAPLAGSLRMVAIGGDGFDVTYPLDASGWREIRRRNVATGVRYDGRSGPITTVVLRRKDGLRVLGRGPRLGHTLGAEPDVVQVELRLGQERYCFAFGGAVQRFTPGTSLLRRNAQPPGACP